MSERNNCDQDEICRWDRTHVWHAFTQMKDYQPLVFESGSGVWLKDIHGNEFLDGVSSLWCNVHGHRHPDLDQAMRDQIDRVSHVTLLGSSNDSTVKLARRLATLAPKKLNHVFFSSDGASAVEAALKMAFQYWRQIENPQPERNKFMALSQAYHGDTIGSVSLGGVEKFHTLFQPLLFDVIRLPSLRMDLDLIEDRLAHFLKSARPLFESHWKHTAALIVEPLMQGAAGMINHPPGMLSALRDLCDEFGILMIADEVAVGIGRTGKMFACQHEDIQPDIICLGKGLTGGYLPLSATIASTEIFNAFLGEAEEMKTLFHGHTFGGNPVAAAVSLANLELMSADGYFESLQPTIDRMTEQLRSLQEHPAVSQTRQVGMMAGIELADHDPQIGNRVCMRIREKQVLLRPLGNVIVVMPPLISKANDIDFIFEAVRFGLDC